MAIFASGPSPYSPQAFPAYSPPGGSFLGALSGGGGLQGLQAPGFNQGAILQLLGTVLQAMGQLAGGWGAFGGGQGMITSPYGPPIPYGQPPGYNPGSPFKPPTPSDPLEFASYLQAQIAGGSLQGGTGIAQRDAIPGSRFGGVQDPQQWNASVARNYAYQFAAFASGNNPLSPQGMAAGAQAWNQMAPDAQLFMQVASVFKGNNLGGPGQYDNPGLRNLLMKAGAGDLASLPGVGQTDVQTIGAITAALNRGQLSLNDVINSGTIDNIPRYFQIINYVQRGGFAQDLRNYDSARF